MVRLSLRTDGINHRTRYMVVTDCTSRNLKLVTQAIAEILTIIRVRMYGGAKTNCANQDQNSAHWAYSSCDKPSSAAGKYVGDNLMASDK